MSPHEPIFKELQVKCGFSPVQTETSAKQLRVLFRIANPQAWRSAMDKIKDAEHGSTGWTVDISQTYFKRTPRAGAELVKAWRLIITARTVELPSVFSLIVAALRSVPTTQVVVDEMPLPGGGLHRNYDMSKGKGAAPSSHSRDSGPALHLFGGPRS